MSDVYLDPSSPEEDWPADTELAVFLGRVLKRFSDDDLWKGLRSGELRAVGYRIGRKPTLISPDRFYSGNREAVIRQFQIDLPDTGPRYARRKVAIPFWIFVSIESLTAYSQKHPAEKRAASHLAELLTITPNMKRDDAWEACKQFGISERGFLERVWRDAREIARLPAIAKAGRKSKR